MSYDAKRTEGTAGAPLILTFHGTGGNETQFHSFAESILPGAHVVSPRGDVSEMGALRYFRRTGEGVYDMDDLARRTEAMAAFVAAEKARTGAERVIGLGYSNGANIIASVSLHSPALFDEMVLLHPLIPWEPEPVPALAGRRVFIAAGERDPICPAPLTHALVGWYAAQGAEVETLWHPGGHEIRDEEVAGLTRFLTASPAG